MIKRYFVAIEVNFQAISTSPSTTGTSTAAGASPSLGPSPMNMSNSLSRSSAVLGFFGARAAGRGPPLPPRRERMGPGPFLKIDHVL